MYLEKYSQRFWEGRIVYFFRIQQYWDRIIFQIIFLLLVFYSRLTKDNCFKIRFRIDHWLIFDPKRDSSRLIVYQISDHASKSIAMCEHQPKLYFLYLRLSSQLKPLRILSKPMLMWFYVSEYDMHRSNRAPHNLNGKPDICGGHGMQFPVTSDCVQQLPIRCWFLPVSVNIQLHRDPKPLSTCIFAVTYDQNIKKPEAYNLERKR